MYLTNDTERINNFKNYCNDMYSETESEKYFKMFHSTILELDIEKKMLNSFDVNKVYKAKGNYCSNIIFLIQKYDKSVIDFLDMFLTKIYKTPISDYCILFYEKVDSTLDNKLLIGAYNTFLKKELSTFNYKRIINLSLLDLNSNNVSKFGYHKISELASLLNSKELNTTDKQKKDCLFKEFIHCINSAVKETKE